MESETEKDIIPEPVEPGGVHPELGGQVDSQREGTVHGVVKESPAERHERGRSMVSAVFLQMVIKFVFVSFLHCTSCQSNIVCTVRSNLLHTIPSSNLT